MKRLAPVFFAVVLFSCQKKTSPLDNTGIFTAELKTQSSDAVRVSNELDAVFNDVDSILENHANVCGGSFAINTADTPNVMAITYNGNTCDAQRSRTGAFTIAYTPGTDFSKPGDSIIVNFLAIIVTRLADNSRLMFNGIFTYRNLSGGKLANLNAGSPVIRSITGSGITVTYDSLYPSNWRFTRQRTYTYNQGIVISTLGTDSAGSIGNVADWGANRFGNSVVVAPTTPLQISQSCGWRLTGGASTLSNPLGATTLNFGLDSTGKSTGCPVSGNPFYFQMAWTGTGETPFSALLPY
jgi:hypothetical protein